MKCPFCGERVSPEVDRHAIYDPSSKKWFCGRGCLNKFNERKERTRKKELEARKQERLLRWTY
jgi:hypothetical protein